MRRQAAAAVCMAELFSLRAQAAALFGASPQVTRQVAAVLPVFLAGLLPPPSLRMTTSYFYAIARNSGAYLLIYGEPLLLFALLVPPGAAGGIWGTWAAMPLSQAMAALLGAGLLWAAHRRRVRARALSGRPPSYKSGPPAKPGLA